MSESATSSTLAAGPAPLPSRYWVGMLAAALFVRGGLLMAQASQLRDDTDGYRELAHNLAHAGVYGQSQDVDDFTERPVPEAFRPPLYPLTLAACELIVADSVAPIAVLHVVLGAATVVIVLAVGWKLGLGRGSLLAASLVLVDPLLLHHSTLAMTETLATLLTCAVLLVVTRPGWSESRFGWALAGGCMGLAALCRPTFLVWIVLSTLWLVLAGEFREGRWRRAAAFFMAAALVVSPWVVRNWAQFGSPIIATTHGGYTLHLANNPFVYAHLRDDPWGTAWDGKVKVPGRGRVTFAEYAYGRMKSEQRVSPSDREWELAADRWHYRQAWDAVRVEPAMFAWSCLVRWGYLAQLAPHRLAPHESLPRWAARSAIGLWYAGLYALVLGGAWRIGRGWRRQPWAWNLLLVASFLLPHTFYWTNMRMRAPLMPVLALTAAASLTRKTNEIKD